MIDMSTMSDDDLLLMRSMSISYTRSCNEIATRRRQEFAETGKLYVQALVLYAERMAKRGHEMYVAVCAEIDKRPSMVLG